MILPATRGRTAPRASKPEKLLEVLAEPGRMQRAHQVDRIEANTLAARQPSPQVQAGAIHILAAYFLERGFGQELEFVEALLRIVAPAVLDKAKRGILAVQERVSWELNDRSLNFDFVEPQRRTRVIEVFDRVKAGSG